MSKSVWYFCTSQDWYCTSVHLYRNKSCWYQSLLELCMSTNVWYSCTNQDWYCNPVSLCRNKSFGTSLYLHRACVQTFGIPVLFRIDAVLPYSCTSIVQQAGSILSSLYRKKSHYSGWAYFGLVLTEGTLTLSHSFLFFKIFISFCNLFCQ